MPRPNEMSAPPRQAEIPQTVRKPREIQKVLGAVVKKERAEEAARDAAKAEFNKHRRELSRITKTRRSLEDEMERAAEAEQERP